MAALPPIYPTSPPPSTCSLQPFTEQKERKRTEWGWDDWNKNEQGKKDQEQVLSYSGLGVISEEQSFFHGNERIETEQIEQLKKSGNTPSPIYTVI